MGRQARRRRWQAGQGLVEFTLALPLFILILVGIFDLGRAVYVDSTIANAARVANRVAIVDQQESVVKAAAVNEAVGVSLDPADVTLTVACAKIGCLSTVEITTTFIPATPIIGNLVGTVTLEASSEMPIERVYQSP